MIDKTTLNRKKSFSFILILCGFLFLNVQESTAQLGSGIKLLDMPKNTYKSKERIEKTCKKLENSTLSILKKIIQSGHLPAETEALFQNLINNKSAMALNKCDKGALYNYINTHLTYDDPLYFQLNGLL
jgi:hypothetical protein